MFDCDTLQVITSISAIVIAIAALFLTIWQSWMMRKHNYNSVKPLLSFERYLSPMHGGFGIYLNNNGLGPAIVINQKLLVDGKEIEKLEDNPWYYAAKSLDIDYTFVQLGFYDRNTVIAAGERKALVTIDENASKEQKEHFKKAIPRIGIEIRYKSIYAIEDIEKLEYLFKQKSHH